MAPNKKKRVVEGADKAKEAAEELLEEKVDEGIEDDASSIAGSEGDGVDADVADWEDLDGEDEAEDEDDDEDDEGSEDGAEDDEDLDEDEEDEDDEEEMSDVEDGAEVAEAPEAKDAKDSSEKVSKPKSFKTIKSAASVTTADDNDDAVSVSSYSSDDSEDEEVRNRIGNVPLCWYDDEDHIGYDISGKKVIKTLQRSEIDKLLEAADNPDAWRTIQDVKNQREVVLTATDLEIIRRLRNHQFPDKSQDADPPMVEFDNPEAAIHCTRKDYEPKRRFVPSKWEGMRIRRFIRLIREGKIRPPPPPKPEVYDIWAEGEENEGRKKGPQALAAPKMKLPGHAESYNPPSEYLFTEQEKKEWEEEYEQDRKINFIPQKFDCLRHVPNYDNFITERFARCLDLYLVPRQMKMKMNVDPASLLPKLPSAQDLRPFPTMVSVEYEGHKGRVRCLGVDSTGRWLATGGDDKTVRLWEVSSGRIFKTLVFDSIVGAVQWNPVHSVLAVGVDDHVYLIAPDLPGMKPTGELLDLDLIAAAEAEPDTVRHISWRPVEGKLAEQGCRVSLKHVSTIAKLSWHAKGNYLVVVAPCSSMPNGQCMIHSLLKKKTLMPFRRLKGQIQAAAFHPNKPLLYVASQKSVRVFDLQQQACLKQLVSGAQWISSINVHPSGDHLIVGTYDRRLIWFDLELGNKPYKTLRYHNRAVRDVGFHPRYPLMASASDDCSVHCMHAKVYDDWITNPLIVPLKKLAAHKETEGFGVLACAWHPTQPWLFSSGADGQVLMWA